jgi:hypothetical protein
MQVEQRQSYRSASPNPYAGSQQRPRTQGAPQHRGSDQGYYRSSNEVSRAVSPAPYRDQTERPGSSHMGGEMSLQLAQAPDDGYGSQRSRNGSSRQMNVSARPVSAYGGQPPQQGALRQRSKSVADGRQFNREGRPILHFGKFSC